MTMIRFNPDSYKNAKGKSVASCWGLTPERGLCVVKPAKKKEWQNRLDALIASVRTVLEVVPETRKMIEVVSLFYDEV